MSKSDNGAARRLARLERVLAGRRARLASAVARPPRRIADAGPLGNLQRYGYAIAVLLAMTAVLPKIAGFALRRRKLFFDAAINGLALRKLRKRFETVPRTESRR